MSFLLPIISLFKSKPTCRTFVAGWLFEKKDEISPGVHDAYALAINQFFAHCGKWDKPIDTVSAGDVLRFRSWLKELLEPGTANDKVDVLRYLFRAAKRDELITKVPTEFIRGLKTQPSVRRPFTLDELQTAFTAADDAWKSMIMLGLYTGQRLGDVTRLRWNNISLDKGLIRLTTIKTGRNMRIPIASPLARFLEDRAKREGAANDAPLHPRQLAMVLSTSRQRVNKVSREFGELLEQCGLRTPNVHPVKRLKNIPSRRITHPLSYHSLRHTAVSMLANAGVPLAMIMEIVGHSSVAINLRYTHPDDSATRRAVEALPALSLAGDGDVMQGACSHPASALSVPKNFPNL